MDIDIEKIIVNSFLRRQKRERALYELAHQDKRHDFIHSMEDYFDPKYVVRIERHICDYNELHDILARNGAQATCYVMGLTPDPNLDGKIMTLRDAAERVFLAGPKLLSCIHGEFAYYESHPQDVIYPRYLLARKQICISKV